MSGAPRGAEYRDRVAVLGAPGIRKSVGRGRRTRHRGRELKPSEIAEIYVEMALRLADASAQDPPRSAATA
jgi:hypothetical protein